MSGRALLNPKAADTLARICGMLGSAHDGERAAAARLADEFVRQKLGLTWHDVIYTTPEWQAMAKACRERARELFRARVRFHQFDFTGQADADGPTA